MRKPSRAHCGEGGKILEEPFSLSDGLEIEVFHNNDAQRNG